MIYQQLVGLRRRQQEGRTLSQGGTRSSGVVGIAQLSQPNVPDASPYPEGPAGLMDLVTALFLDARRRWVLQVVKALSVSSGSSFRATCTGISNAGRSQASSS
jgi:hypothetical protein